MKIDLHAHTTQSDGRTPPMQLAHLARERGVAVLAVTDHDTVDGVAEAQAAGREVGVRVVPGIEVSSRDGDRDVHILGIGVNVGSHEFQERLRGMRAQRRERVTKIVGILNGLGVPVTVDEVLAEAHGKSVGRKHVARALVKHGHVSDERDVWDRYLATGRPANVPANELSARQAVELIRLAGGVPVLAHPGFFDDDAYVERLLEESGVRGIEVWHKYDSDTKHLRYLEMGRRRDLVLTGGSDYHGDEHVNTARPGDFCTPVEEWRRIEAWIG